MKGLETALERESRVFEYLLPLSMKERFGFYPPNVILMGEKTHDKIINPNFMTLLSSFLQSKGNTVLDGVLTEIYTDNPSKGGYVKIDINQGSKLVPFNRLVLSLGSQRLTDKNGNALLDIVAARGISSIALLYLPKDRKLPSATVCGATNHVTFLQGPVPITRKNSEFDCYLVKLTCSACITPNIIDETCADYDSIAAVGLLAATRQTLDCEIEPLTVWGCNRQVSRYGQSHWLEVKAEQERVSLIDRGTYRPQEEKHGGIFVQLGAGGGGLTIGPSQPPL